MTMQKEQLDKDHEARGFTTGNPLPPTYQGDRKDTKTGEKDTKTTSNESREDAIDKVKEEASDKESDSDKK